MTTRQQTKPTRAALAAPRFVQSGPLMLAGFSGHFDERTRREIPALWAQFAPHIGRVPGQTNDVAYGVCLQACDGESGFDYLAAVEVRRFAGLPNEFHQLSLPALPYAVFPHRGHVTELCGTIEAIMSDWLPASGCERAPEDAGAPAFFERYGERFDPAAGEGDVEVWLPLRRLPVRGR